jgi:hypothetical protein
MTGWIATVLLMGFVVVGLMIYILPYIIIGALIAAPILLGYYCVNKYAETSDIDHKGCEHLDEF